MAQSQKEMVGKAKKQEKWRRKTDWFGVLSTVRILTSAKCQQNM
jgi:hypothetical protein